MFLLLFRKYRKESKAERRDRSRTIKINPGEMMMLGLELQWWRQREVDWFEPNLYKTDKTSWWIGYRRTSGPIEAHISSLQYSQWDDLRQTGPSSELALNKSFFSFLPKYMASFHLVSGKQMNLSMWTWVAGNNMRSSREVTGSWGHDTHRWISLLMNSVNVMLGSEARSEVCSWGLHSLPEWVKLTFGLKFHFLEIFPLPSSHNK